MMKTENKLMEIVKQEIKDIEDFQFSLVNNFIRTQPCFNTLNDFYNDFYRVRTKVLELDAKRQKYVEKLKLLKSLSEKECKE